MMIRQDWVDNEFLPVVPYLGFDYQLMEGKEFFLKGNIARNYQQPSLNDLYWQPGGNPDLKPERGISGELGTEYNVRTNFFDIHSELTAYYSDINDWIIWIPSYKGYWEPQNIKNVVSKGLEMNVRLKGKISMMRYTISGLYSYTSSVNYGDPLVWGDDSHGKQLPYVPEHSGNVFVKLSYKNYFISFQHNYYSERYTTSSNDISKRNTMYPYFMNDLKIGREMQFRKFSLSGELKINNLFDETYHSILQRPMPGRNYMLMLMIKF
jgi:iron complex outermembrane receptor protein